MQSFMLLSYIRVSGDLFYNNFVDEQKSLDARS